MRYFRDYPIAFGLDRGSDLIINTSFDTDTSGSSCLGETYSLPLNSENTGMREIQSYLAGGVNFRVIELEVYSIQ